MQKTLKVTGADWAKLRKMYDVSRTDIANAYEIPLRTLQRWEANDSAPLYVFYLIKDNLMLSRAIRSKNSHISALQEELANYLPRYDGSDDDDDD